MFNTCYREVQLGLSWSFNVFIYIVFIRTKNMYNNWINGGKSTMYSICRWLSYWHQQDWTLVFLQVCLSRREAHRHSWHWRGRQSPCWLWLLTNDCMNLETLATCWSAKDRPCTSSGSSCLWVVCGILRVLLMALFHSVFICLACLLSRSQVWHPYHEQQ